MAERPRSLPTRIHRITTTTQTAMDNEYTPRNMRRLLPLVRLHSVPTEPTVSASTIRGRVHITEASHGGSNSNDREFHFSAPRVTITENLLMRGAKMGVRFWTMVRPPSTSRSA